MAIRITKIVEEHQTILKVDGWLKSEDVAELCRTHRSLEGAVALDLSELQSADRDGVAILRKLTSLGTEIRSASPYFDLLLKPKA